MLIFEWILLLKIQKDSQKLSLKGKISWTLNVFTLPNLKSIDSKNLKNKRMCSQWANGIKSIMFRSCPKSFGMFTCWFTEGQGSLGKGVWQTAPVGAGCFGSTSTNVGAMVKISKSIELFLHITNIPYLD